MSCSLIDEEVNERLVNCDYFKFEYNVPPKVAKTFKCHVCRHF